MGIQIHLKLLLPILDEPNILSPQGVKILKLFLKNLTLYKFSPLYGYIPLYHLVDHTK